jgi:hypothetical protein
MQAIAAGDREASDTDAALEPISRGLADCISRDESQRALRRGLQQTSREWMFGVLLQAGSESQRVVLQHTGSTDCLDQDRAAMSESARLVEK